MIILFNEVFMEQLILKSNITKKKTSDQSIYGE